METNQSLAEGEKRLPEAFSKLKSKIQKYLSKRPHQRQSSTALAVGIY